MIITTLLGIEPEALDLSVRDGPTCLTRLQTNYSTYFATERRLRKIAPPPSPSIVLVLLSLRCGQLVHPMLLVSIGYRKIRLPGK